MSENFWKPGNIVRLKHPVKPDHLTMREMRNILGGITAGGYAANAVVESWKGYTHGIIAEIVATHNGVVTVVSLHLYDPATSLIRIAKRNIPEYQDFPVDELIPYRRATDPEYEIMEGEYDF